MNRQLWLAGMVGVAAFSGLFSYPLGRYAERKSEMSSLRSAALEMSLSGSDEARRSALVLKSWADALAAKP